MDTNETKEGTNRRNFLGAIATGAAAIGLTTIAPSLSALAGEARFDPETLTRGRARSHLPDEFERAGA